MRILKQSSTAQPLVFLMVDSSDHISAKTGLSPTVTISKNGGSFASPSGAVTEIGSGWYKVAGNATDTNTLGPLILHATATGADPTDVEFEVVSLDVQTAIAQTGDGYAIVNNATYGLSPLLDQVRLRIPRKTWYVAASGGSDSNAGTLEAPLATREQAVTNARNGDTIHLLAGTYSWTTTWDTSAKKHLTIEGDGVATLINFNTSTIQLPTISLGDNSGVQDFKIVCTGLRGSPISAGNGIVSPFVRRMWIEGKDDAVLFNATNAVVTDCYLYGTWDVLTLQYGINVYAARNYILGTSSLSTGKLLNFENATGVSENNTIIGVHSTSDAFSTYGIFIGLNGATVETPEGNAGVVSRGDKIFLTQSAGTGRVAAVSDSASLSAPDRSFFQMEGGAIEVTNSVNSAKEHHIRLVSTGGIGKAVAVTGIDRAKCTSNVQVISEDISDAADSAASADTKIGTPATDLATVIDTNLDAKVSDLATSIGDIGTLSDPNSEPVSADRTFVLSRGISGLTAEISKSAIVGSNSLYAIDFRNDIAANDWITAVTNPPTLVSGTSGGVTFGTPGRDHSQVKVKIAAVTAGTYVIEFTATYHSGNTQKGRITFRVVS